MDLLRYFRCQELGTYATVIAIFAYTFLLHEDMTCTCENQQNECNGYMILPFLIVFFIILLTDKTFRTTGKYYATFKFVIFKRVIKASLIGLLWVVALLLDGDWYICCKIDEAKKMLPCKSKNLTLEEFAEINELKNTSQIVGYVVLLGVIFVAVLMSCQCGGRKCCCNRETLYYRIILEEEKKVLDKILREEAKNNLENEITEKIRSNNWQDCFKVAKEMIDKEQKLIDKRQQNNLLSVEDTNTGEPAQPTL